jgi:molecular chaperone DnaJ
MKSRNKNSPHFCSFGAKLQIFSDFGSRLDNLLKIRTIPPMTADFYETLGVKKDASKADIKKAFRSAAQKHHPDKGGDPEKFKKIQQAYETLSDDSKRSQYDQFGSASSQYSGSGTGGFSGFGSGGGFSNVNFDFGGMEDIFSSFFGGSSSGFGGRSQKNSDRGNDLEVELVLDFDDAIRGIEKTFSSKHFVTCEHCEGRGGENPKTCDTCGGSGYTAQKMSTPFGTVQQRVVCSDCGGSGISFAKKCKHCHGEGRIEKSKKSQSKFRLVCSRAKPFACRERERLVAETEIRGIFLCTCRCANRENLNAVAWI